MADQHPSTFGRLIDALSAGTRLDLIPEVTAGVTLDAGAMRAWPSHHNIDSGLLRDLLLGRTGGDPDPRGLQLRGARILGRLDLQAVQTHAGEVPVAELLDRVAAAELADRREQHPLAMAGKPYRAPMPLAG